MGELSNYLMGCALVMTESVIYRHKKTKKGAVIGCIAGFCTLIVISALLNYFVLIPAYAKAFNAPTEAIIGMGTKINKSIINMNTLILLATVPFNALKGASSVIATILIYKPISKLLKRFTIF
jgi:riboflavin transporter FmnP